jgi:hypothetical protein
VLAEPLAEECRLALGSAVSVAVLLGERLALVQVVGEMEPLLLMLPVRQVVAEAEGQRDCVGVRHCVELTEPVREAEGQAESVREPVPVVLGVVLLLPVLLLLAVRHRVGVGEVLPLSVPVPLPELQPDIERDTLALELPVAAPLLLRVTDTLLLVLGQEVALGDTLGVPLLQPELVSVPLEE